MTETRPDRVYRAIISAWLHFRPYNLSPQFHVRFFVKTSYAYESHDFLILCCGIAWRVGGAYRFAFCAHLHLISTFIIEDEFGSFCLM